ncbi:MULTISPECIES: hypothetical protein [Mesorhizobium]|uniref:hypothetical protein n=1 Tax=Mesorhizobium TaxID=68287 RepID=UPI0012EB8371|nr:MULTISPECIES: hypothetical protein [Mesorhizobium]WJI35784.1 hypothetical protein NL534_17810 [Mesorhizobium opportunistum]
MASLSPSSRAGHHHHHLTLVVDAMQCAFAAMDRRRLAYAHSSDPFPMLKTAWKEIERASKALPGFEPIDLSQSCCAGHIRLRNRQPAPATIQSSREV